MDAHAAGCTRAARVPTRVIHIPAGGDLIFHLHQEEIRSIEVVALDVIGISQPDHPGSAAVQESVALSAFGALIVVVHLQQGELVVGHLARAVQRREHVLATIEGRRIDHGS